MPRIDHPRPGAIAGAGVCILETKSLLGALASRQAARWATVVRGTRNVFALRDMLKESGLIRTLPGDLVIYRVRSHKKTEQCTTREALGPPPGSKAPSNRMSAAGISVFYGAFEMATAAIEARRIARIKAVAGERVYRRPLIGQRSAVLAVFDR